jgi:hemolysin activation/secretion protein
MSLDKLLKYRISRYSILLSKTTLNMSISTSSSSTRLNGSIKPLRGKENYITWSIKIENVLLRNNNAAYIQNGSRAARPRTRYLDDYNRQLEQYDLDLEAYDAAVAAAGRGRAPIRPALPKKPNEAKGEEKELKT